jgi:predicted TIM-barrel fold metal-dependent hydrolase
MRIDVHAHCFPMNYLDLLDRLGGSPVGTEFARKFSAGDSSEELDERIRLMDGAGVERQVLSVSPQFPYFAEAGSGTQAARLANDLLAELVGRYPKRFLAFGVLPLPHADAAIAETARCLDELGMAGVTAATSVLGRSIADAAFDSLFAELDRRGAVLFLHPAGQACGSATLVESKLTWPLGAPVEDAVALLQLLQAGVPARFPRVRIVASHLGGVLPFLMRRLDHQAPWFLPERTARPSELLRRFWYDSVNANPGSLRCACEAFGSRRILLGSDFPYWRDREYGLAVRYVANSGLANEESDRILEQNAAELLGIAEE